MKRDSEIIRDLISLAFDTDPEQSDITLVECLGLYERSLRREREIEDARVAALLDEIKSGGRLIRPISVEDASAYSDIGDKPPADGDAPSAPEDAKECPPEEHGRGKAEKQSIYNRLKAFRDYNGLGCLNDVAAATGGKVDADMLRAMLQDQKFELKVWRQVGAALDKLSSWLEAL